MSLILFCDIKVEIPGKLWNLGSGPLIRRRILYSSFLNDSNCYLMRYKMLSRYNVIMKKDQNSKHNLTSYSKIDDWRGAQNNHYNKLAINPFTIVQHLVTTFIFTQRSDFPQYLFSLHLLLLNEYSIKLISVSVFVLLLIYFHSQNCRHPVFPIIVISFMCECVVHKKKY